LELFDLLILGRFLSFDVGAVGLSLENDGSFFKELLLPLIELDGVNLVLVDKCRYRHTIEEVLSNNRDLLLGCWKPTFRNSGTSFWNRKTLAHDLSGYFNSLAKHLPNRLRTSSSDSVAYPIDTVILISKSAKETAGD
jgi:hypothetical protein